MACFAPYFKQDVVDNVRADVDLVIRRREGPDNAAAASKLKRARRAAAVAAPNAAAVDPLEINRFPAHSIILNASSDYFRAQGARWQAAVQPPATPTAANGGSSSAAQAKRPAVHLSIDTAEQLPAAEAVIAAMYGVPGAVSGLMQQQMVHAVIIADMVVVGAAGQQAVQALQAAAQSEQGLTAAALQALAGVPQWPSCMLQLLPRIVQHAPCCRDSTGALEAVAAADAGGRMQQLLVAALGDLQAVWSDAQLQALLLGLPLPAMQLLLSSDQLRVLSEDTVLHTAKHFVQAQNNAAKAAAAKAALVRLVRVPRLSLFALSCAAQPAGSGWQLLGCYAQKLRDLLPLKMIATAQELATALQTFEGAPASWLAGPRQIVPLGDGVRLEWRLPVQQLQQACRDFAQQKVVHITSSSSPPLGGVAWLMTVTCEQKEGGTVVGLFAGPAAAELPASIYYKFTGSVSWQGRQTPVSSPCLNQQQGWGYPNYFSLRPMAGGGWDAAAWAAAGLATAGDTLLELRVRSVT